MFKRCRSLVVVLSCFADVGFAQTESTDRNNDQVSVPVLEVIERDDNLITGFMSLAADRRIEFSARMEAPSRAIVEVQIGDLVLDANADFENGDRHMSAHRSELSPDDKSALTSLAAELSVSLQQLGQSATRHETLLVDSVSFWASVPVGIPILDITRHRSDEISGVFISNTRSVTHAGSLDLIFASRLVTPTHVLLDLQLGDHVLSADIDLANKTAILNGSGRALSIAQIQIMDAFGGQYTRYLLQIVKGTPLPNEDMFFRALSVWGNNPPGWPLKSRLVLSANSDASAQSVSEPDFVQGLGPICGGGPEELFDCHGILNCLGDNNDGIRYLGHGCTCAYYNIWHDSLVLQRRLVMVYPICMRASLRG